MKTRTVEAENFASAVIDALSSHICVVDKNGLIIAVNRAWQTFAAENPPATNHAGVGCDYIEICRNAAGPGSDEAPEFAAGVKSVLEGEATFFQMEYPCHSPAQYRWFLGCVTPLMTKKGGAVISHVNITDRKLLELELEKLAATDPLTEVPNRRYFLKTATAEIDRVKRFGTPASVVMIDLDNFKSINDIYGHASGDEALQRFARHCKKHLARMGTLARIGGEEFAVVLPGMKEQKAVDVAEKLRRALCTSSIEAGQVRFNMTASFGVAEVYSSDKTAADCLGRADKALYAAKAAGRNCVMGFSTCMTEDKTSSKRQKSTSRASRASQMSKKN